MQHQFYSMQKVAEIVLGTIFRIEGEIVQDIISMIGHGRMDRRKPQGCHSHYVWKIIQLWANSVEITDAVAVAVGKTVDKQLVGDFALLLAKLSADVSVLDLREVTLMNPYWDQIQEKCPGIVIRLKDGDIMGIVNIASEMLQPGNAMSYDLFGRRIQHPAVGQLFIRNGKKMIER